MQHAKWLSCFVVCVSSFAYESSSAELPEIDEKEQLLEQRMRQMLTTAETLRQADQADLAAELLKRADAIGRELQAVRQMRQQAHQRLLVRAHSTNRTEQEANWRAEMMSLVKELREQVHQLQNQVGELHEQLNERRLREEEARFAEVDLSGSWQMTLPAGFKYTTVITEQANQLYRLKVTGNLAGLYRHHGKKLIVEVPSDARLTEFVWEFQDEDLLLLTESPPAAKVGADYRGATLSRLIESDGTDEPSLSVKNRSTEKPPKSGGH